MKPRIRVGMAWRLGYMKDERAHWTCQLLDAPNRSCMGMGPTPEAAYQDWLQRNQSHGLIWRLNS